MLPMLETRFGSLISTIILAHNCFGAFAPHAQVMAFHSNLLEDIIDLIKVYQNPFSPYKAEGIAS